MLCRLCGYRHKKMLVTIDLTGRGLGPNVFDESQYTCSSPCSPPMATQVPDAGSLFPGEAGRKLQLTARGYLVLVDI